MMVLREGLVGAPIMSLQTGGQIGVIADPIIDPRQLQILAFYCEGPAIGFSPAILHTDDIREYSSIGLIVDSADNIMPSDDLVRLEEVLKFQFELDNKKVVDDHGHKLGKVINYSVDTESFFVIKLHIKPAGLQSFGAAELLIDRQQISAISNEKIVVKAPTVKEKQAAKPLLQAPIENPFRRVHPQPEPIVEQPKR